MAFADQKPDEDACLEVGAGSTKGVRELGRAILVVLFHRQVSRETWPWAHMFHRQVSRETTRLVHRLATTYHAAWRARRTAEIASRKEVKMGAKLPAMSRAAFELGIAAVSPEPL